MSTRTRGRPRSFDEDQTVDQVVDIFWKRGYANTTTRVLEAELGLTQSSLYNTFGSKQALLDRALDRYENRLEDALVHALAQPDANAATLVAFVDDLVEWVSGDDRRGCLLINLQVEADDPSVVARGVRYRDRLRELFAGALGDASRDTDEAQVRSELVLASALGICAAARGGASRAELEALAGGVRSQIAAW